MPCARPASLPGPEGVCFLSENRWVKTAAGGDQILLSTNLSLLLASERRYGGLFHHLHLNPGPCHSLVPFLPKL